MNNKNEESKRAFVPKTIGDSLKKINRDISNKYGKIEYLIIAKWPKIVGQFFANHSEPDKISRIPDGENDTGDVIYSNYLHINVSPVAAVEFQHFKDKIIDKINSYFGYKAISNIRLKQNFIPKKLSLTYLPPLALKAWYSPSTHSVILLTNNPVLSFANN